MNLAGAFSFLLLAPALFSQAPASWDGVKQLAPGSEVRAAMRDGRKVRGGLQSATDDTLVVAAAKSPETLSRAAIAKVAVHGKSHRLRNALIGLGVGAGAGLISGAISERGCAATGCFGGKHLAEEVLTPVGALIGVTVGALIPTGGWHEIYRAK